MTTVTVTPVEVSVAAQVVRPLVSVTPQTITVAPSPVSAGVTVTHVTATVTAETVAAQITVPPTLAVAVAAVGLQGQPGAGANVGPGFKLVGSEIRYDIASLTRG